MTKQCSQEAEGLEGILCDCGGESHFNVPEFEVDKRWFCKGRLGQAHAGSGKPRGGTGLPEGSGKSLKGFKETTMIIFVL